MSEKGPSSSNGSAVSCSGTSSREMIAIETMRVWPTGTEPNATSDETPPELPSTIGTATTGVSTPKKRVAA